MLAPLSSSGGSPEGSPEGLSALASQGGGVRGWFGQVWQDWQIKDLPMGFLVGSVKATVVAAATVGTGWGPP